MSFTIQRVLNENLQPLKDEISFLRTQFEEIKNSIIDMKSLNDEISELKRQNEELKKNLQEIMVRNEEKITSEKQSQRVNVDKWYST